MPDDIINDFEESRIGLEEETDNDDSCGEESEVEGEESEAEGEPAAKRPAAARVAKRASTSGRGKRAVASSAAADSSDEEAADSSDEEAAKATAKRPAAAPAARGGKRLSSAEADCIEEEGCAPPKAKQQKPQAAPSA